MRQFRVVDCRAPGETILETVLGARTPEEAARQVFGLDLVRGGTPDRLVAKVYFEWPEGAQTLVRFYTMVPPRK